MESVIYNMLSAAGLNPYFQGQYVGLCNKNYVTIKITNDYKVASISTICELVLFSPRTLLPNNKYPSISAILLYKKQIVNQMLSKGYRLSDDTPVIIDEDSKAYTCSLRYQIFRRR